MLLPALLVIFLAVKKATAHSVAVCAVRGCGRHHGDGFFQGAGLHETFTFANSGYSIDTGVPRNRPACSIAAASSR